MMLGLDWFRGAPDHWRERAFMEAEALRMQRVDQPVKYAVDHMKRARRGSFQRRHWRYISKVLAES
jgi:hypothetical protein